MGTNWHRIDISGRGRTYRPSADEFADSPAEADKTLAFEEVVWLLWKKLVLASRFTWVSMAVMLLDRPALISRLFRLAMS